MNFHVLGSVVLAVAVAVVVQADEPQNKIPAKASEVLTGTEVIELYSLDPEKENRTTDGFRGWKVLGKTTVRDETMRQKLVAALREGVEESDKGSAGCFNPRHGIRVTHKGATVDFVICFECHYVYVYENAKDEEKIIKTTGDPQATFDKVLADANVPLPEKPKK
jgi:hypothetical protein